MIARLVGTLVEREPTRLVIDVNGVGYEVQISLQTFAGLPAGDDVTLFVHTRMRDSGIHLFGFSTRAERTLFTRLQTVSGVGPRLALGMLSGKRSAGIAALIRNRDTEGLKRLPGVGKRTAERLVADLCEKVDDLCMAASTGPGGETAGGRSGDGDGREGDLREDARLALANLGYREPEVVKVLDRLSVPDAGPPPRLQELLRDALRLLARG
ncbi:MAG: Holliday junction branch migration protein RuvA [Acidobacteriota bacterium]